MSDFLGAGLAFPLQVDRRGGLALAHEGTDVEQAIGLILSTAPGERPMRPEFGCGVHDYVFERVDGYALGRIEHEVRVALKRWEPRVEVLSVGFDTAQAGEGMLAIEIGYRLLASNDVRNL
ncbi:MAG TPA: GPW/gp25 family protein, partial [Solirubrobacteraceae bacterium]|nr:GPW/gp25 family protein [Solirubrobacteraceae bacterium]